MCMLNANTVNLNTHLPYRSYYEYVFLLELLRELRDQILSLDVPSHSLSQESLRATDLSFTISATRISGMAETVSNTLVACQNIHIPMLLVNRQLQADYGGRWSPAWKRLLWTGSYYTWGTNWKHFLSKQSLLRQGPCLWPPLSTDFLQENKMWVTRLSFQSLRRGWRKFAQLSTSGAMLKEAILQPISTRVTTWLGAFYALLERFLRVGLLGEQASKDLAKVLVSRHSSWMFVHQMSRSRFFSLNHSQGRAAITVWFGWRRWEFQLGLSNWVRSLDSFPKS
jgi:hypothetical protein